MTASPPTDDAYRFDDLNALFINCTLKPSPQVSHTQGLIDKSAAIMMSRGVTTSEIRAVDFSFSSRSRSARSSMREVDPKRENPVKSG